MRLPPSLSVLAVLSLCRVAGASGQQATLTGSVVDATSHRRVDAALLQLDDATRVRANAHGDFLIKDVAPGAHRLRVSRIGYRSKVLNLPISRDDAKRQIFVDVSLEPLPVELEPVVIRADTASIVAYGAIAEFYRHRRSGYGGRFITRRDIERRQPFRITDMLVAMPGVWFSYDTFGDRRFTFRSGFAGAWRGGCAPAVFLNGARTPDWIALDDMVSPEQVEGIEVYAGDLAVPAEYWGGCGALAVWTL